MNKVLSGRFNGKKIRVKHNQAKIMLNYRDGIPVDSDVVDKLQILNIEANKKVTSGVFRGLIVRCFGVSVWLSALQSAKSNYIYICKLTYRDGTCSTIALNSDMFNLVSTHVNIDRVGGGD